MVGDVASRMPVHSQNRSVTASDRPVRFMQLSVYAVVVADSTARPGLVASSATQNVVVFPPLSTRARSPRGYSTPEPDASVLLSIWRMIWNTDPAGIVTPAPGSFACVSNASMKNAPGTSLAKLIVWYDVGAESGSPLVPGASRRSWRYPGPIAEASWWRYSTALERGTADAWLEFALSTVPSYARTT